MCDELLGGGGDIGVKSTLRNVSASRVKTGGAGRVLSSVRLCGLERKKAADTTQRPKELRPLTAKHENRRSAGKERETLNSISLFFGHYSFLYLDLLCAHRKTTHSSIVAIIKKSANSSSSSHPTYFIGVDFFYFL